MNTISCVTFLGLTPAVFSIEIPPLPQAGAGKLRGNLVHRNEQDEVDHVVEQADGSRIAELLLRQADLVHIGGDDLRTHNVQIILHQEHLLVSDAHDAAHIQNQKDHHGGNDRRQINVPDPLQLGGAVHLRGLMQRLIHACQRGQINDGVPPHVLPDARPDINVWEILRNAHVIGILGGSEHLQHVIEKTGAGGQEHRNHADQNHRGNKVRHVGDGLRNTPETIAILGNAVSSISEQALRNISETIRTAERSEKQQSKFFAENNKAVYTKDTEKNNDLENTERTVEYGRSIDLQTDGRLSDTQPDIAGNEANREIRNDEINLPQEQPQEPLLRTDDNRETDGASGGNGQNSERTDTDDSRENGENGGHNRSDESQRSAEVDRADEQFTAFGGGNRTAGGNIQLSLFDDIFPTEEQQQNTIREAEQRTFGAAFIMPQQIVDKVLCDGTNESDSVIKICVEFSKNKPIAEKAAFLKKLYGVDGKGFVLNGSKVAAWWNEQGISISYGTTAQGLGAEVTSWENAAKRIDELLDLGRFAPQDVLLQMRSFELMKTAEEFWELHRDLDTENYPVLAELFPDEWFKGGYPDSTARIAELLKSTDGYEKILNITGLIKNSYANNDEIMRFQLYNPVRVYNTLSELQLERKAYTSETLTAGFREKYISDDEINNLFVRQGSGVQNGKYRIYLYFKANTDTKDRIAFLKNEYGTGGSYNGRSNNSHDSKGIKFSHGSLMNPFAKADISWNDAVKRIDRLIKQNKYLSEKEIANIPQYEKEELASNIVSAFYHAPEGISKPFPDSFFMTDSKKVILPKLEDAENAQEILSQLKDLLLETPLDDKYYNARKKAADNLERYITGDYNLFPYIQHDTISPVQKELTFAEKLKNAHLEDNTSPTVALFPLGDFYETYGEDANKVADTLDLHIVSKEIDGTVYAMCGFPKHTLEKNIDILTQTGFDVVLEKDDGELIRILSYDRALETNADISEMTEDDKQGFIDSIDTAIDYGGDISDEDMELYRRLTSDAESEIVEENFDNEYSDDELASIYGGDTAQAQKDIADDEFITPEFEKPKPQKTANTVIYPEIPMSEHHNFKITNDELGYGTPSEKFAANTAAIRTLKTVESEHRLATPEEQEILSGYVGWGSLADCFDEKHSKYQELKSLLTPEEYASARASTLTSHFTSPTIIKAMYKALGNMGFQQGNILEPSCGIGNFMGLVPESMSESKFYGIELDGLTGRIAQQLYQKSSVAIQGFEDTSLPDSFFDVAIGNVPFGDFKVLDKKYNKHNFLIHDFFFAKTLDKVRPGGVVAFITSSGTMDKRNGKVRKYIAQRADLLGAIRLPNTAFKKNAGTEVTADILFLQKRDRMTDIMPEWVNVAKLENEQYQNEHQINQYFIDNPDMIMGEMVEVSGPFGPELTCMPDENSTLAEQLDGAIQNIHAQITEYEFDDISNDESVSVPADPSVKNFSYTIVDGDIYFRENSVMNKVELNATAQNRIKGMIEIRDCVRTLIEYQTENYSDNEIKEQQSKLNKLYDDFTRKYGLINSRGNNMAFSDDSSYFLLCSLEVLDENGELERKADMFTKRTIGAKTYVTKVDTADEALAVSIGEKAMVDIDFMSELTDKSEEEIYSDLKGVIFKNPLYDEHPYQEDRYLTADAYLSGNVRVKLREAETKAETDSEYNINIEYLQQVQPKDLSASEIGQ